MHMALMLGLLFCVRGFNIVGVKFAQKGRVTTLCESIIFITIYSAMQMLLVIFIPPYSGFITDWKFYIYPFAYASFYFLANIFLMKSLSLGSASVANTIGSFNCLVVIIYSMIFWGERLTGFQILGLALFVIGLILYNGSTYSVGGEKKKISLKWLGYVLASTLLNGIAVIFTKISMQKYPQYGKEYLVFYCFFAALIGTIVILFFARDEIKAFLHNRKFLAHTGYAALSVDTSNLMFVSYINLFPTAIFVPSFSVVGMLAIMMFGRVFLKEHVSKSALISSVICIAAILCLNIT